MGNDIFVAVNMSIHNLVDSIVDGCKQDEILKIVKEIDSSVADYGFTESLMVHCARDLIGEVRSDQNARLYELLTQLVEGLKQRNIDEGY